MNEQYVEREIQITTTEEAKKALEEMPVMIYNKFKGKSFMLLEGLIEDSEKLNANKMILQGYIKSVSSYVKKVTDKIIKVI